MITDKGTPKTSHTTNKVPFVMANAPEGWSLKTEDGVLVNGLSVASRL